LFQLMVIMAETDLVGSVTEVAVMVTVFPAGTVGGAWYVVGVLLATGFGVKVPHSPAGTQVKLTVALSGPLVTTAAMPAVSPVASAVGGGKDELNVTTIAGGWYLGSPQATKRPSAAIVNIVLTIGGIGLFKVAR
jgi:hypothetical protein